MGEGENIKSNTDQKVSHKSRSHGNSEHEELQVWGLKKAAVVKQLSADAQGPLCYFIIVYSAHNIELAGFPTVLQDEFKWAYKNNPQWRLYAWLVSRILGWII